MGDDRMVLEEAAAEDQLRRDFLSAATWEQTSCWVPRRCWISGRWMWGRHWRLIISHGDGLWVGDDFRWLHREQALQIRLSME